MVKQTDRITVYYDGACPKCLRDRDAYLKMAGSAANDVDWVDITGRDWELCELGIDPRKALTELHVRDGSNRVHTEIDAYRLLMLKVPRLKPLAWLIGLSGIRQLVSRSYHWQVNRRLRKQGRV